MKLYIDLKTIRGRETERERERERETVRARESKIGSDTERE